MAQQQANQGQAAGQHKSPAAGETVGKQAGDRSRTGTGAAAAALPPPANEPACGSHCVDVTGRAPEGIRIDPDITEGHPGYQESGDSEVIPPDRLAGQGTAGDKGGRAG